jgi:hypothetical protein
MGFVNELKGPPSDPGVALSEQDLLVTWALFVHLFMQRKQLLGIAKRAESAPPQPFNSSLSKQRCRLNRYIRHPRGSHQRHGILLPDRNASHCDRPAARNRFRRYWSFLSPGIIVIRWALLGPVKREAERRALVNQNE